MSENFFGFFNQHRSYVQTQNQRGTENSLFQHPIKRHGTPSGPLKPTERSLGVRKPLADCPVLAQNFNTPQAKPVAQKVVPSTTIKVAKPKRNPGQIIYKDIPDNDDHIWPESERFSSDDIVKILNSIRSAPAPLSPKVHLPDDPFDLIPFDFDVENIEIEETSLIMPTLIEL